MWNLIKKTLFVIFRGDKMKTSVDRNEAIRDNWETIRSLAKGDIKKD